MAGFAAERTIDAPAERVWALLVDAEGYPVWNPSVVSVQGTIAPGERIRLVSTVNPKRAFVLKVSDVQPPHRMVWSSGMPLGLFRGARTFTLESNGTGTRFRMAEEFSGPLAPLVTRAIPDMTESFAQFADGLKAAAERP